MFFQILSLIKGREGTQLKMEFRRDGKDFEVELVRRHADGPQQPSILMDLDHPLSHHRVSGLENGQNFAPPSASRFTRVYVSMPLLCRLLALQQAVPV